MEYTSLWHPIRVEKFTQTITSGNYENHFVLFSKDLHETYHSFSKFNGIVSVKNQVISQAGKLERSHQRAYWLKKSGKKAQLKCGSPLTTAWSVGECSKSGLTWFGDHFTEPDKVKGDRAADILCLKSFQTLCDIANWQLERLVFFPLRECGGKERRITFPALPSTFARRKSRTTLKCLV